MAEHREAATYLDSLSNASRFGPSDRIGTLNYIDQNASLEATRLVRHGVVVSCSWDITPEPAADQAFGPPQRFMVRVPAHQASRAEGQDGLEWAIEFFGMVFHGQSVTHLDGLGHGAWNGVMYNNVPAASVTAEMGSAILSITDLSSGVVTRGVLLDIVSIPDAARVAEQRSIEPSHLEQAEEMAGVKVGRGDAVLIRTGFGAEKRKFGPGLVSQPQSGLNISTLPWLHDRGVALIGADMAHDARPSITAGMRAPIHAVALTAMGMPLLDNCDLESLHEACVALGQWEFLFVVSPLRISGGTGSPVNPLAIL